MTEPSAMELAEAGLRHAEGLTAQLDKLDWMPRRSHIEQARNSIQKLAAALRTPPAQGEPVVTPSDLVEVLENVRAGIEKIKQTKILSGGPGYIDASFVPIEIYKACHSLEHLTRGLRS